MGIPSREPGDDHVYREDRVRSWTSYVDTVARKQRWKNMLRTHTVAVRQTCTTTREPRFFGYVEHVEDSWNRKVGISIGTVLMPQASSVLGDGWI